MKMLKYLMSIFRLLLLITVISGFNNGNAGKNRPFNGLQPIEEKSSGNIAQILPTAISTSLSSQKDDKNYPDNIPTTLETAKLQFLRLFDNNIGSLRMSKTERFLRISIGWSLLIIAKSAALASPLYFRALVNEGKLLDNKLTAAGSISLDAAVQSSAVGLIIGYGSAKLFSGLVQLICELILSSATVSAAEALPQQAFKAALNSASRRWDDGAVGVKPAIKTPVTAPKASAGGRPVGAQDEGRSGFARRALDRGLRASNQFLYRSVFNLLPSFIEAICVVCLMVQRAGTVVGVTAGIVAYSFVGITIFIMQKRIPLLRRQLRDEGIANGCAEDALSLAETVASFGAMKLEEDRYAQALARVSRSNMKVRYSFSLLKLIQSIILGFGAAALIFVTWKSSSDMALTGPDMTRGSIAGQLVLVQSLFAQLCAPLDHVGQHFRDCVSAAEDLRDLESLKRVLSTAPKVNVPKDTKLMDVYSSTENTKIDNNNIINQNDISTAYVPLKVPQVYRQYGGPKAWPRTPPRLELKNLIFSYPSVGSISKENGFIRPILNNISFIIPPGGFSLGIVGPSGSGKSTILRVLLGLEPIRHIEGGVSREATLLPNAAGSLHIDGMDVSGYDRIPCFALAGQDSDLFRGLSLVDNIRYGTHTMSDSFATDSLEAKVALDNAAEDAQLDPLLQRLQGGWDAAVGPRGRLLSGGERQRVCLARALYREELSGGILLMDEVTASLDAKTESLVTNAVSGRVKKGATAILIAHRLSSVQHCDMIVVMKDGEIIERGTHAQLIRKDGWYSESWKLQSQSR